MLFDAIIPATCDGKLCTEEVHVKPEFVYADYHGHGGQYDVEDDSIHRKLRKDHGWIVDGDKHYCCDACKESNG